MSGHLKIRNWDKWQSYRRDRGQPPWIKVHRCMMRNLEWVMLSDAERGQLVAIWLLAADHDGVIPASPAAVQKLCHMSAEPDLEKFMDQGFIERGDIVTSKRRQGDAPETETETETDSCALSRTTSRFDEFWQAYPSKRDKKKARDKWKSKRLDAKADEIISDVKTRISKDRQWREGYIPLPTTYLNGERWEDELDSTPTEPNGPRARVLQ